MSNVKINDINFREEIDDLENLCKKIQHSKNFLDDYRVEYRRAVESLQRGIYHSLNDSFKEAEKSLLIKCYTLSEQMYKQTKYELINYDETEATNYQKFLNNKLNPNKFSPNSKIDEINKFFKRYDSSSLFLKKLPVYDNMIISRHTYAHRGRYSFNIEDIPKLIKILRYLEFEYRMFLSNTCWTEFFLEYQKINRTKQSEQEEMFNSKKEKLQSLYCEIIKMKKNEKNMLIESFDDKLFNDLETLSFQDIKRHFDTKKDKIQDDL